MEVHGLRDSPSMLVLHVLLIRVLGQAVFMCRVCCGGCVLEGWHQGKGLVDVNSPSSATLRSSR